MKRMSVLALLLNIVVGNPEIIRGPLEEGLAGAGATDAPSQGPLYCLAEARRIYSFSFSFSAAFKRLSR
jgi:hypothetical protein